MPISRSAILRYAHAAIRERRAPMRTPFPGFVLDRAAGAFVCTVPYREIFSEELRRAWAEAKARAKLDAIPSVEIVLTDDQRAEIERLEQLADWQPISFLGNERCAAYRLQAACIRNAAARNGGVPKIIGPKTGPILQSKVHSGWSRRRASEQVSA